ncbi:MAG: carbohydrate kinase family protein [Candidatus Levybacteria bacterium]|nr:carbohydrate kinase family protein [Candidatus Levybacteria bacterium]
MIYDVVTIGNVLIDAFLHLSDHANLVRADSHTNELRIGLGQKIPLDGYDLQMGGNAANVAVGLRRTGYKSALMAEVGEDELSSKILHDLEKEKVEMELLHKGKGTTSLSVGLQYKNERILFTHHQQREHNFDFSSFQTRLIYLTSLGHSWLPTYKKAAEYVQKHHTLLAFNPGSIQLLDGAESFSFLFPLLTVLFVNKEEAEKIVGEKLPTQDLLTALQKKGSMTVCLTDGEKGAYAIDSQGQAYYQEKIACPVIEKTGAGDAFASGFLAAMLSKHSIKDAMLFGAHNAASVIGHMGAQKGLLEKEDLERKL